MSKIGSQLGNATLPKDSNRIAIQVGGGFQTNDVTGTPITSPYTFTTSEAVLIIPDNAIQVSLMPTVDLRVYETTGIAQYDLIKANIKETIGVANKQALYFKGDVAGGSLYFKFVILTRTG